MVYIKKKKKEKQKTKKAPNYDKIVRDTPKLTSTKCTYRKHSRSLDNGEEPRCAQAVICYLLSTFVGTMGITRLKEMHLKEEHRKNLYVRTYTMKRI